ncbi:MAG: hypothetical protein H0V47_06980 [Chloroflexia bacterium]|nr:hypothetical protein [Chloroflexia bacterium]
MSREAKIGAAGITLALIVVVLGAITGSGEQGTSEILFTAGIALVAGAIVFGLVVPWAKSTTETRAAGRPERTGLVMSILGFLTIVAFWSGLPIILGAGGAALGQVGRERSVSAGRGRLSMAAIVVGGIAAFLGFMVFVLERAGV